MENLVIGVFIVGYLLIAFEHTIRINKTATAIITGVLCWTIFMMVPPENSIVNAPSYQHFLIQLEHEKGAEAVANLSQISLVKEYVVLQLGEHLAEISQILFFLLAAMTIVELIDAHKGFHFITSRIRTQNPVRLLWIVVWVTFFLSAVLDNLTTSIVMVSMIRKLLPNKVMRWFFAGMIIVAANAGGAWTPMGDVTTTMLWIGGQITSWNIIQTVFLPSVATLLVPMLYLQIVLRGKFGKLVHMQQATNSPKKPEINGGKLMLILGVSALLFVPIFKTVTHLPPYLGILLGLGILWVVSESIHPDLDESLKKKYTVSGALTRIDTPSVLFFLGILLAVSALQSMEILSHASSWLDQNISDQRLIIFLIGALSAVVDNVPLVAASMAMYSMDLYPTDHIIWEFLAYCAGTGGSMLIIGSAAGVAVMGMERITFIWFFKKISLLALMGYVAGAAVYLLQVYLTH
ncbi:sodium:proton antiporter NhaD [Cytophagales bacterium LB-30]|uniref:Sodium:proton antiporter NhaD n=1 Tax=Shiella aurantiaca TaxID=3058365 RepID=A0ABT8F7Q3_9BACT|nr:sodium:proton antiporter NhaD [Shiella aurantiaca]MDN4166485.1 sodium:proton antiporter NhaD [Shiella aurantiaca]